MLIEIYSTVVLMSDEAYELLDSILVSKRLYIYYIQYKCHLLCAMQSITHMLWENNIVFFNCCSI